jgi:hypothetical protein
VFLCQIEDIEFEAWEGICDPAVTISRFPVSKILWIFGLQRCYRRVTYMQGLILVSKANHGCKQGKRLPLMETIVQPAAMYISK